MRLTSSFHARRSTNSIIFVRYYIIIFVRYYIAPDGNAFVVIRQVIKEMNIVAILGSCSRVARTSLLRSPVANDSCGNAA
jgi:hypothetical protein